MKKNSPFLSVIIPAFNEADNFHLGRLDKVVEYLNQQQFSSEILVVNDGSTDNTSELLHRFANGHKNIKVIDNPHMGKAATVMTGVEKAEGKYILFTDMDQATPITETEKCLKKFESGADVVIGSRQKREGSPVFRIILAYGMIVLRTVLLRLPFKDTQCGFKAFTKEAAEKIFPILRRVHPLKVVEGPAVNPGFDVELLYIARKMGLKIAEIPVLWKHQETKRVSFIKDSVAGVRELLLVRVRALSNTYKLK